MLHSHLHCILQKEYSVFFFFFPSGWVYSDSSLWFLISFPWMDNDIKHLFICLLTISIFYFVKCLCVVYAFGFSPKKSCPTLNSQRFSFYVFFYQLSG